MFGDFNLEMQNGQQCRPTQRPLLNIPVSVAVALPKPLVRFVRE